MDPIVLIPITLLFVGALLLARFVLERRRLTCPEKGTTAEVGVVRRLFGRREPLAVKRCSLLPGQQVTCDQDCLKLID